MIQKYYLHRYEDRNVDTDLNCMFFCVSECYYYIMAIIGAGIKKNVFSGESRTFLIS